MNDDRNFNFQQSANQIKEITLLSYKMVKRKTRETFHYEYKLIVLPSFSVFFLKLSGGPYIAFNLKHLLLNS